jgi:hypothetical protein
MFNKGYVVVDGILHPQLVEYLSTLTEITIPQCKSDPSMIETEGENKPLGGYNTDLGQSLLSFLTPFYNKITGENLIPTYSYFRTYYKGNDLKPHIDRNDCEYSATIQLTGSDIYPIFIENRSKQPIKLQPNIGSIVFYKGIELSHWREKLEFDTSSHVFLHWKLG